LAIKKAINKGMTTLRDSGLPQRNPRLPNDPGSFGKTSSVADVSVVSVYVNIELHLLPRLRLLQRGFFLAATAEAAG
jgi:hypothetical protein